MNFKKTLLLLFAIALVISCDQDELIEQSNNQDANLSTNIGQNDETNYGLYKGTFTTLESTERGIVEVQILKDTPSIATLELASGKTIEYISTTIVANEQFATKLQFESASFNSLSTFDFYVELNGNNPKIKNVSLNSEMGLIKILKETSRGPLTALTGSYTNPQGSGGGATWNMIFNSGTGAGADTDITTQIMIGGLDYGQDGASGANSQSNCTIATGNESCDIDGTTTALPGGGVITWSGKHIYLDPDTCSWASGAWTMDTTGYSGTFITDSVNDCLGCLGNSTTETGTTGVIADNTTQTFTATTAATGTIGVDAGIVDVNLNITHTFDGDLNINLISPLGTTVALATGIGGTGDNYTETIFTDVETSSITSGAAPFSGPFNAQGGSLNTAFDGESITGIWTLSIEDTATGDSGVLDSWTISFCDEPITIPPPPPPPPGCNGTVTTETGATGAIPDNACPITTDFIATTAGTGSIGVDADIENVTLNITHTFDGDLNIELVSPLGTRLALSTGNGGLGANYTNTVFRDGGDDITLDSAPFTGVYQPQGSTFAVAFDGELITGDWLLSICDSAGGDTGTLDSWSIGFCDEVIADVAPENDNATKSNDKARRVKEYKDKSAYQKD